MARELKYHTQDTDFSALQRELGQSPPTSFRREEEHDPYAGNYSEEYDDDPEWARRSG